MTLFLYQLFFPLVAAGILLRLLFAGRGEALREGLTDIRQRCGLLSADERGRLCGERPVWFHAASVGEVTAVAPLLRRLKAGPEAPAVLLTTTTVTGRERARSLGAADLAVLAPMDFLPAVRSFLRRAAPYSLILVETELWPMTLTLARRSGVRLGLANGRITERAYSRYRLIRGLMGRVLSGFERASLQSEEDARRFRSLGLPEAAAVCSGNMKYDLPLPPAAEVSKARTRLSGLGWKEAPVWCAGSTRRGEEERLLRAHRRARERHPRLKLILAPRHPERTEEVEGLLRTQGLSHVRWSEPLPSASDPDCLLIDALGVLPILYPLGGAAFVGGTLVAIGGHNLLEPALSGVPVLFGPHTSSVREVASALASSGGGVVVRDEGALAEALDGLFSSPERRAEAGKRALGAARGFAGATDRTLAHLSPLLKP